MAAWGSLLYLVLPGVLALLYFDDLDSIIRSWLTPEYSHGALIPLIASSLVWQRSKELARVAREPSWWGVPMMLAAIGLHLAGELSTVYLVIHYSLILSIAAITVATVGWAVARIVWPAWLYLFFMIPVPDFFEVRLSLGLQLMSSEIGVSLMRALGVSVFLQGNVIDLGAYELQVAEACSGLRYLFPLLSFGFLVAYLYKGPFWHRALLFLSAVPITVLTNSLRIAVIGVLVDRFGIGAAEGFLHWFEGWVIFMLCLVVLFFEVWAFTWLSRPSRRVIERLDLSFPALTGLWRIRPCVPASMPLGLCLVLLVGSAAVAPIVEARNDRPPPVMRSLATFPLTIGDWRGSEFNLDQLYLEALQLDDYLLANYGKRAEPEFPVNLYVAWYASQRKGFSIHSPRSCLPGDGWEIADFSPRQIDGIDVNGRPLSVNRALIRKGNQHQLVYYWFDQRGRSLTSEYLVKWFILWDGVTQRRTDGALIRLTTPVRNGMALDEADRRLTEFLRLSHPRLMEYMPG